MRKPLTKWRWPRFCGLCLVLLALSSYVAFLVLDARYPFPRHAFTPPAASLVQDRHGETLRAFLPLDGRWRFPVRLDDVAPEMQRVLVASEDRFFRLHPGVNPFAILRSAWINMRAGRVVCGGSTIQMQLARLAWPRERTLKAKFVEAFRALQLGRLYSKDQLLELYLNMAPFGGNIVGIGAAARFYCGKDPARLSLGEAALLTVLPRAPRGYDPVEHPEAAKGARDRLLDVLARRGVVSYEEAEEAKAQELPARMRTMPLQAPHLARELQERFGRPGSAETIVIKSTVDGRAQRLVQAIVRGRMPRLREQGLENAAVVVLEHKTREVRALVGAPWFFDEAHHGQIDATRIKRSPGSTLKPFLYALAMEEGRIAPETWLLDVPTDFAGYVARNYDDQYRGRVSVREALTESLNAPAVRLLARVGVAPFLDLLRRAGLRTLDKPASYYGLPLILGGGEVHLLDLVNAYAMLAQGGLMLPVRDVLEARQGEEVIFSSKPGAPVRLLSAEACHLLGSMLSQVRRSDLPQAWNLARDVPAVAWKTGTSYGHRDAWAVGYSGTYAIGVWVGNVDGRPELGISGSRHAGPLLFELFRALEPKGSRLPEPEIPHLDEVEVCAASRQLATPLCEERMRIEVIAGVTRIPRDQMHRRIFVDAETGERLEGDCLTQRPSKAAVARIEPPELTAWRRSRGMVDADALGGLPPLSPLCAEIPSTGAPKIVSPSSRTPYLVRSGVPREFQRVALSAQTGADAARLYWYQDGELVASGGPGEKLFLGLDPGVHRLVLLDGLGRQDSVTYRVQAGESGSGAGMRE